MKFKRRPVIGVTVSKNGGMFLNFCLRLSVLMAGGKPVLLRPSSGKTFQSCNGFVISGGADINPELYGQENRHSLNINPERDALEQNVIEHALDFKKPMLGICRGMQMLNVEKGGTLHQNVSEAYQGFIPTTTLWAKALLRRMVLFSNGSYLKRLFAWQKSAKVNSIHHQSVNALGDGLKITAEDELGVVQSLEHDEMKEHFILGVQWHPELLLFSKYNRNIFKALVGKSRLESN